MLATKNFQLAKGHNEKTCDFIQLQIFFFIFCIEFSQLIKIKLFFYAIWY